MQIESGQCEDSLKDVVREYYFFSNHENEVKYVPVIDDCCYDIIFFKEADTALVHGIGQEETPIPFHIFTIHGLTPPYKLKFEHSLNFFTVKVQPWTNAHFFSFISNPGITDLKAQNSSYLKFYEQIFQVEDVQEKFVLADEFMKQQFLVLPANALFVKEICQLIYEQKGMISVNEISKHFQKSRQYIGKLFKQHVLYSLKKFIITVRILDLIQHRRRNPDDSLTELCYQYDYFDQSHFIKDFKQVCGVTPSVFFDELPKFLLRH